MYTLGNAMQYVPFAPTYHSLPQYLILDLPEATWEFLRTLQDIKTLYDMYDGTSHVAIDIAISLVEYLQDKNSAYEAMVNYTHEIKNIFADCTPHERELLSSAARAFGIAIYQDLERIHAWDPTGALWYRFDRFLGTNTIILVKEDMDTVDFPRTKPYRPLS